jgi:carbon-monoxide dehydrogenase medium subunit
VKPFTFHSPQGLGEAVDLLERLGPGATVIAGGQTLLLAMKERLARPSALISLAELADLRGVRHTGSGVLEIGAATTYAALAGARLPGWHAEIAAVAGDLADRPVRTMGTIGGALCAADPRFDMVTLVVGLGAELDVVGPGGARAIPAAEFFLPDGGTVLAPGEILTTIRVPALPVFTGVAFEKFRHRVFEAAVVSAVCALRPNGTRRITVGAVHPAPTVMADGDSADAGRRAADELMPESQATTQLRRYQRELARVLVTRAIARAQDTSATNTATGS